MINRPYCLTIAGYDPCGGAGIIADVKTMEMHMCQGMGVITANTLQTEDQFFGVQWIDLEIILEQIKVLMNRYEFKAIKIGLVKDIKMLDAILDNIPEMIPIVWDPVLKSSSGFVFHKDISIKKAENRCTLITPNLEEFQKLWGSINWMENTTKNSAILLKGGHSDYLKGTDSLFINGNQHHITGKSFGGKSKHGTGCVLSSAIVSQLALGNSLLESCIMGKKYVEKFILSNETNWGYHYV